MKFHFNRAFLFFNVVNDECIKSVFLQVYRHNALKEGGSVEREEKLGVLYTSPVMG